jgi:hypothetical protein
MISRYIPHWLAWPVGALSTLGALAGSGLMFYSAAYGEYVPAIWAVAVFVGSGLLWYVSDMAAGNRPLR